MLIVATLITTNAMGNVYLRDCYEYQQQGVSYSYQSCVSSNFSSIQMEIGGYMNYCSNFGNEVSYSFTSCIQNNFDRVQREIPQLYLSYCSNFDRERLSYSFTSCVNRNFQAIQNEINNQDRLLED